MKSVLNLAFLSIVAIGSIPMSSTTVAPGDPWWVTFQTVDATLNNKNNPTVDIDYLIPAEIHTSGDPGPNQMNHPGSEMKTAVHYQDPGLGTAFSCGQPLPSGMVKVDPKIQSFGSSASKVLGTKSEKTARVTLDIEDAAELQIDSNVWTPTSKGGKVSICVRTELVSFQKDPPNGIVTAYDETNIDIEIDLTVNLVPLTINAVATPVTNAKDVAAVKYIVEAQVCELDTKTKESKYLATPAKPLASVTKNDNMRLCIKTLNNVVKVQQVNELKIYSGSPSPANLITDPITTDSNGNEMPDILTTTEEGFFPLWNDASGSPIYVVNTQLLGAFFSQQPETPPQLTITGEVLLEFTRRRGLRRQEEEPISGLVAGTQVFQLEAIVDDGAAASMSSSAAVAVFAVLLPLLFQ